MMISKRSLLASLLFATLALSPALLTAQTSSAAPRWTAQRANQWYAKQPWLVGANFIPSDAINELEMFQAATFNPALNDKELGGLDSVIAARKMTSDLSDKYENIVIPINNNASIAHTGDNTGLKGGEGLSVDNLMRLRQNSFEQP